MDFIELGGQKRPIKFGLNTLRVFSKEFGISLNDLGNIGSMTFDLMLELVFAGLKEGAKKEGQQVQYTIEHLCDWVDEKGKLDEALGIFADQFGGESEGNQEAPATG